MRRALLAAGLVLGSVSRLAGAQAPSGGSCILEFDNTATSRFRAEKILGTEQYNSFLGGGVVARCAGQDVTLRSDSAEYYGAQGTLFLIGSVSYIEPRVRVNSVRMTYFQTEDRLLAEENVDALLPTGTTMRGPRAEYFREIPGVRPRAQLIAPGRPRFNIVQRDSGGGVSEPTVLVADRVTTDGDSLVYAGGRVEIDRSDVSARGDSAFLDSGIEFARLMRGPSIQGKGQRPFTLRGGVVDLYSSKRQLQRVVAAPAAEAISEDLHLTSDTIDMRVANKGLDRAYAWGPSRARATSPQRDIIADSLDVQLPNQRVREVRAVRDAYAATVPDTLKFRSTERDWLRGDTIVARFDSLPTNAIPAARRDSAVRGTVAARDTAARDSAARPRIRELEAQGSARSFYQVASQRKDSAGRPSVNYVSGRNITVAFDGQTVQTVTVLDKAAGVYLEPTDEPESAAPTGTPASGERGRAQPAGSPATPPGTVPRTPTTPSTRPPRVTP